jgi:ABC-type glucose/galactose transport system permease subunit
LTTGRRRGLTGLVLCVVGGVWFAQGIGALPGSFMSGEAIWAVIGSALVLAGVALIASTLGSSR